MVGRFIKVLLNYLYSHRRVRYTGQRSSGDHWVKENGHMSQKQRKSRFSGRSLCTRWSLSHLSFGLEKCDVHWKITVRSLSAHSAFVERLLPLAIIDWEIVFGLRENFEDTVATVEITGRSLTDQWEISDCGDQSRDHHWQISERSWWWMGALWKIVEKSGHFCIA